MDVNVNIGMRFHALIKYMHFMWLENSTSIFLINVGDS